MKQNLLPLDSMLLYGIAVLANLQGLSSHWQDLLI